MTYLPIGEDVELEKGTWIYMNSQYPMTSYTYQNMQPIIEINGEVVEESEVCIKEDTVISGYLKYDKLPMARGTGG